MEYYLLWCIHYSFVSAILTASPLGSHWESGDRLIGWYRGHLHAPPGKSQGPSTSHQDLLLLTSQSEGHPQLQVEAHSHHWKNLYEFLDFQRFLGT